MGSIHVPPVSFQTATECFNRCLDRSQTHLEVHRWSFFRQGHIHGLLVQYADYMFIIDNLHWFQVTVYFFVCAYVCVNAEIIL